MAFSKIADSYLPGIIDGEKASLVIDKIQTPESVVLRNRQGSSELGVKFDHDIYYYEVAEFINLIVDHKQQSEVNSWATSLATIEIIDEIRRQMGVVFPADNQ